MNLVHVTETNIDWDYRIIKQLNTLSESSLFDITVVCSNKSNRGVKQTYLDEAIDVEYVRNHLRNKWYIPSYVYFLYWFVYFNIKVFSHLWRICPDIVHVHDATPLLGVRLYRGFNNFKIIYDAHELNHGRLGSAFVNQINYILEKFAWSKIDVFVSVSESIIEYYSYRMGGRTSSLISNQNEYYRNSESNSVKISAHTKKKEFVFVGALVEGRSIERILEVFAKSELMNVSFIGYGALSALIEEFDKRHKNITLVGPVSPENLVSELSKYDCGLNLLEAVSYSDYLALPNKFYEYYNANIPQVVSDFPELSKKVILNKCGYIYDDNLDLGDFLESLDLSGSFNFAPLQSFRDELLSAYKKL